MEWLRAYIKGVCIELSWETAFFESIGWKDDECHIRGEQIFFFFDDRQAVLDRLVEAGRVDEYDDAYYPDGDDELVAR